MNLIPGSVSLLQASRHAEWAVIGALGVILLAGCGRSSGSDVTQFGSSTSSDQSHNAAALSFSRCMRSHGVPSFPDPDPQGDFPNFQTGVSKQASSAATDACKQLLRSGGGSGTDTRGAQKKFAFALQVARCMRAHGYPTYPDPATPSTSSQGSGTRFEGTGIDTRSPQFQSAETTCENQARKSLGLP